MSESEALAVLRELVELNDDEGAHSSFLAEWAEQWEAAIARARALVSGAVPEWQRIVPVLDDVLARHGLYPDTPGHTELSEELAHAVAGTRGPANTDRERVGQILPEDDTGQCAGKTSLEKPLGRGQTGPDASRVAEPRPGADTASPAPILSHRAITLDPSTEPGHITVTCECGESTTAANYAAARRWWFSDTEPSLGAGVGNPCVMPAAHQHRDGIGGPFAAVPGRVDAGVGQGSAASERPGRRDDYRRVYRDFWAFDEGRPLRRPGRIILTGSRSWSDRNAILRVLADVCAKLGQRPIVLAHGSASRGADPLADGIWLDWHSTWPEWFLHPERHPADWGTHGKAAGFIRNQKMVSLGADFCAAFALSYASGTGHCARAARKAGIPTQDFGVNTEKREA